MIPKEFLEELIKIGKEAGVYEISLEKEDEFSLKLSFPQSITAEPCLTTVETQQEEEVQEIKRNIVEVKSMFVGKFSFLDPTGKKIEVKAGDSVKKGQVIGGIEVLGIIQKVESPVNGKILEILTDEGKIVQYGQVLFRVEENA